MPSQVKAHRASAQRRRAALLQAAAELAAEIGAGAVTHRAVAARAGVPLSTTSYFFSSIDELVTEALRRGVTERTSELDAVARVALAVEDGSACSEAVIDAVVECVLGFSRAGEGSQVEFFLAAGRDPALRAEATGAVEQSAARVARHLARAGAPGAAAAATAMVAHADGAMLHRLASADVDHREQLRAGLRLLAAAAMLDDAEVEALLRRYADASSAPPAPPGNDDGGPAAR